MSTFKGILALVLSAAVLGACAELRAEAPLFSPADQTGPPPLREGVWIAVGEGCAAHNARRRGRFPRDCTPLEITRAADGAWRAMFRVDLISNLNRRESTETDPETIGPHRMIIAPAVERVLADDYAPIYVVELGPRSGAPATSFAVLAPIGTMPAEAFYLIASIGCEDILRDGEIADIKPEYRTLNGEGGEYQQLSGCVASSQAAVREAARRAVIENIDTMTERRYTFARPR